MFPLIDKRLYLLIHFLIRIFFLVVIVEVVCLLLALVSLLMLLVSFDVAMRTPSMNEKMIIEMQMMATAKWVSNLGQRRAAPLV